MSNPSTLEALVQAIEEYQQIRVSHDRLLSYSTDFEVSPDSLARVAELLAGSWNAVTDIVTRYRQNSASLQTPEVNSLAMLLGQAAAEAALGR